MSKKGYDYEKKQEREIACKKCGHKTTFICFADAFPNNEFVCIKCGGRVK